MKKIVLAAAIAIMSCSPAWAFMTLRQCVMTNTLTGVKWIGTYCDTQNNCVRAMFDSYCPYML